MIPPLPRAPLLEIGFAQLDDIRLYESPEGEEIGGQERRLGDSLSYSAREIALRDFVYPIVVPANATRTFHMRVTSTSLLSIPIEISGAQAYYGWVQDSNLLLGAFYGLVLGLMIYCFVLFWMTREWTYFFHASMSTFTMVFFACTDGLAFRLWPTAIVWQTHAVLVFALCSVISLVQYSRLFLEIPRAAPRAGPPVSACARRCGR